MQTDTKLSAIAGREEFAGIRELIFPRQFRAFSALSLGVLQKVSPGLCADDISAGFDFLARELASDAKIVTLPDGQTVNGLGADQAGAVYFPSGKQNSRWAVVVPGGGYAYVSFFIEGWPIALALHGAGYSVFVLNYRCGKNAPCPAPLDDLASVVSYGLEHAGELGLRDAYSLAGFSAGGHTAALFGTEDEGHNKYGLPAPSSLVLGYPVITMGKDAHAASRRNFLGGLNADDPARDRYSVEKHVTRSYPPTFIRYFDHDAVVDPRFNSEAMARALSEAGVKSDSASFSGRLHGFGVGSDTKARGWLNEAIKFMDGVPAEDEQRPCQL